MYVSAPGDIISLVRSNCQVGHITRRSRFNILLKGVRHHNDRYLKGVETSMITNVGGMRDTFISNECGLSFMNTCSQRSLEIDNGNSHMLSGQILVRRLNGTRSPKPA